MKLALKIIVALVLAVVLTITIALIVIKTSGIPTYPPGNIDLEVEVTPERVERGKHTAEMLCVGCHLDNETGTLAGKPMLDLPAQFGWAHSANITGDAETGIARWTDGELAYLLRTGVRRDGRYTPPWMVKLPLMADEDLKDVIAFLRSDDPLVKPVNAKRPLSRPSLLTKVLARVVFKPIPYPAAPIPTPDPADPVAHGKYLVQARALCYGCHSLDFAKVDEAVPERSAGYLGGGNAMPDMNGRIVKTSNITPDPETGIGKWSEDELVRLLRFGVRPDATVIVYPMVPFPELSDGEARAIYAYLRTVPPIKNAVPRPEAVTVAGMDAGRAAYYRYGCNGCHGDTGVGLYDLRKNLSDYPTEEALIAYIKHPEISKPGVKMPTWDGVIAEADYAPLVAHVRALAAARK
ncbi:MAG TPA: c-type cytochrome [Candidatus Polarisedimenticolaceae bacterium]|nr:c-type cytochrome [Candidatus Polarisedimenticolaceae bacterium]